MAVSPTVTLTGNAVSPNTHWFLDSKTGGWFKDSFTTVNFDPIAICEFDGDSPNDRVTLIGSDDGYIRFYDTTVARDDGDNMTAFVTLGPLTAGGGAVPLVLRELQAISDQNSHSILYEVLPGEEPEDAMDQEASWFDGDGTFAAGLSKVVNPRTAGYYQYVKVGHSAASTPWSMEAVRTRSSAIATSRGRHE